jgi:hypothetical protein
MSRGARHAVMTKFFLVLFFSKKRTAFLLGGEL